MGSLGEQSLVLFFLFLRLVPGVVATLARFLPKAVVKVVEVADMPMVVVVVALGGSRGTSASGGCSGRQEWGNYFKLLILCFIANGCFFFFFFLNTIS